MRRTPHPQRTQPTTTTKPTTVKKRTSRVHTAPKRRIHHTTNKSTQSLLKRPVLSTPPTTFTTTSPAFGHFRRNFSTSFGNSGSDGNNGRRRGDKDNNNNDDDGFDRRDMHKSLEELNSLSFGSDSPPDSNPAPNHQGNNHLSSSRSRQTHHDPDAVKLDLVDVGNAAQDFGRDTFLEFQSQQLALIGQMAQRQLQHEVVLNVLTQQMTELMVMAKHNQHQLDALYKHHKAPDYITNHNLPPHERINEILTGMHGTVNAVSTEMGHLIKTLYPPNSALLRQSYGQYKAYSQQNIPKYQQFQQQSPQPQPQSPSSPSSSSSTTTTKPSYPPPTQQYPPPTDKNSQSSPKQHYPSFASTAPYPYPPPTPMPPRSFPKPTAEKQSIRFDAMGNVIDESKWKNWSYPSPVAPETIKPTKTYPKGSFDENLPQNGNYSADGSGKEDENKGTNASTEERSLATPVSSSTPSSSSPSPSSPSPTPTSTTPTSTTPPPLKKTSNLGRPTAAASEAKQLAQEQADKAKISKIAKNLSNLNPKLIPDVISDIPEIDLDLKF